jgi:hypothetical protein
LKNAHSSATQTSTTRKSYTDCCGIATSPTVHVPQELLVGPPDPAREPVQDHEQRDRRHHDRQLASALERPDHDLLDRGAAEERDREREEERRPETEAVVRDQRPRDVGREHPHLALREVDHVRRAVDQDEREREARVDRAVSEPRHDLLHELRHQ